MKGIITVLGKDSVGIIGRICMYLADEGINIQDISQTIVGGYFNMMMIVDLSESTHKFEAVSAGLKAIGGELGLEVKLQREDIFDSMHRI